MNKELIMVVGFICVLTVVLTPAEDEAVSEATMEETTEIAAASVPKTLDERDYWEYDDEKNETEEEFVFGDSMIDEEYNSSDDLNNSSRSYNSRQKAAAVGKIESTANKSPKKRKTYSRPALLS